MRILLDTNIIIHREAAVAVKEDIGVLFRWIDNLHYTKCVHPITVAEIEKHEDPNVRRAFRAKIGNYNILKTTAPMAEAVRKTGESLDKNQNDRNDTLLVNELYCGRVDALISEDRKVHDKATLLGMPDRVFSIDEFLEKVTAENPNLVDYGVLSVRKALFGALDLSDTFFDSFRTDYPGFEAWFNKKADETAYVCLSQGKLIAFLYVKVEEKGEDYSDINPTLQPNRRLKIGSFKVSLNGFRLGERFLKIVFDNAIRFGVDEIYVTIFDRRIEQQRLINLLRDYGFSLHGNKRSSGGEELVYVRSCRRAANRAMPKVSYPFFSTRGRIFMVPIYPAYHTELFPDSILRTESAMDFVENEPHRNAISKSYISRSVERAAKSGDVMLFYRTADQRPAYYHSVVTTIGVIENLVTDIRTLEDFVLACRKRSVFTDADLARAWDHNPRSRPFVVNFLYLYSLPKRLNLKGLIDLKILGDVSDAPRGFLPISDTSLMSIMRECQADESIAVD